MNSDFSSHADNFGDALQTKVDPRTGQFMVNFPVAHLIGNHQLGPELSLSLGYSPLNSGNYGFGNGFSLGTTKFNDRTHLLQLINGEQYRVMAGTDKVRNQKLDNFRFRYTNGRDDSDGYTVFWKDGKIEKLSKSEDNESFVTTKIISPLGRFITITWDWSGQTSRITKIEDESKTLCEIVYGTVTSVKVWPETTDFYQLDFEFINDDQLDAVTRHVSDSNTLHWNFIYDDVGHSQNSQNQLTLTGVDYPTGMKDRAEYNREGLQFPNSSNRSSKLPCVLTYRRISGGNQPDYVSQYEYTAQNFLGYNGNFGDWSADSDYVYTTLTDYTYGSTETVMSDGVAITTERTYNNYHLQIAEEVNRQGNIHRTEMAYYAEMNCFIDDQPAQFNLLKEQKGIFRDANGNVRETKTLMEFDEFGNPIKQIDPDGTETITTWYGVNGEDGCPAQPNGFVRFLKEKRVIPPKISGSEPEKSSRYTYTTLSGTAYVVLESEMFFSNEVLRSKRCFEYESNSGSTELGRIITITNTLYDMTDSSKSYASVSSFKTTVSGNQMTQETTNTLHDGIQTTSSRTQSVFSGRVHRELSSIGIETRYDYDGLGRLKCRTICPESEYETTTTWEYGIDQSGPYTIETDASGNKKRQRFDGSARLTSQHIFHSETGKWYEISSASRNSLGEVVSGTVKDWLPGSSNNNFPLTSDIRYGNWGEKKEVRYSDGRQHLQHVDPINLTETSYTQGSIDTTSLTTGSVTTTYDPKSQLPITKQSKDVTGNEYSRCRYNWDGLRQLLEEYDELGAITKRTYDEYGRVLTQTSPDGTIVTRTYAPHLTGNHIASISVTGLDADGNSRTWLLGTQTFDSLGRLTKSVCGGRTTSYSYLGAVLKPSTVTLPSDKTVSYTYIPELGYAVSSITCDEVTQNFHYDKKTGQMLMAQEAGSKINYSWSPMGDLREEKFSYSAQNRHAKHTHSLNGAPMIYTDVTGKQTTYNMDSYGRVSRITDESMLVYLQYDALGRVISQTVHDMTSDSSVTKTLAYDDFGREITRTISNNKDMTLVLSQTWQKNNLLAMRTTTKNGIEIRQEQYEYDKRNRLYNYNVTGNLLPVDAYGQPMLAQSYRHDALNNITSVVTTLSDRSTDTAKFFYLNDNDPTQLSKVTHTHKKYPKTINLSYDTEGRMTCDEAGRALAYDTLGRLVSVTQNGICKGTYTYDALNRLITQNVRESDNRDLYYRGSELVNEIIASRDKETRLIKTGHTCLGMRDDDGLTLTVGDQNDSLLWSKDRKTNSDGQLHVWSPYGSGRTDSQLLGFNGERIDPVSGTYHLGNGYRAYNPVLMRFNCPDDLSPFDVGGINPYAYCDGDPVNHVDPSGHLSWQAIVGITAGVIGLALAAFTAGASIAAAGGVMAAISSASATSLIVGGLGVISDVTAIASGALEDADPSASSTLGWISLATGLVGMVAGFRGLFKGRTEFRSRPGGYDDYELQVLNGENRTPEWHPIEHNGKMIYGSDQQISHRHVKAIVDQIEIDMDMGVTARKNILVLSGTHGTPAGFNWNAFNKRTKGLLEGKFFKKDLSLWKPHQVGLRDTEVLSKDAYTAILDSGESHVVLAFCFSRNEQTLRHLLHLPVVQTFSNKFTKQIERGRIVKSSYDDNVWVWERRKLS